MKFFKSSLVFVTLFFSTVSFASYERMISNFSGYENSNYYGQFNFEYLPEIGIVINNKELSRELYLVIPKEIDGKYNEDFDRLYALILKASDHRYTVIFTYDSDIKMAINVPSQDYSARSVSSTKKAFILKSIKLQEASTVKVSVCNKTESSNCVYVYDGNLSVQ